MDGCRRFCPWCSSSGIRTCSAPDNIHSIWNLVAVGGRHRIRSALLSNGKFYLPHSDRSIIYPYSCDSRVKYGSQTRRTRRYRNSAYWGCNQFVSSHDSANFHSSQCPCRCDGIHQAKGHGHHGLDYGNNWTYSWIYCTYDFWTSSTSLMNLFFCRPILYRLFSSNRSLSGLRRDNASPISYLLLNIIYSGFTASIFLLSIIHCQNFILIL